MDEEKAKKFLSHADFARLDCIHYSDMSLGALNTLYENVKHRHKHRAELLGIVDRLLATTAGYAAQVETLGNGVNAYAAFGHLKPWFGGPQAGLTLKPEAYDRVFGQHNGVAWSFQSLVNRISWLESALDEAQALADKPMAILDDAQGYYTVNVPGIGQRVSVKTLIENYQGQGNVIRSYQRDTDTLNETINRKDAKLIEQQKRIDELEAQVKRLDRDQFDTYRIFAGGHRSFTVGLEGGGQINLAELVSGYERLKKHARTGDDRFVRDGVIIANLAGNLRQTEEDYGDVMVALMDAEERNDVLVRRLDRIEELTDEISDVGVGLKDEELAEDEMMADDEGVSSAVVDNSNPEVYFVDIEIGPGIWGCMAKYGKKD